MFANVHSTTPSRLISQVFATSEEELITDLSQLGVLLPQFDVQTIQLLLNVDRGCTGGHMHTLGLLTTVQIKDVFVLAGNSIKPSEEYFGLDLENEATSPPRVVMPKHLEFEAEWNSDIIASGEENNILGDNRGFYFKEASIHVPVVQASSETLAYYGAVLIRENIPIRFSNEEPFPLWRMDVGTDYVRDYIMDERRGGGFYLEYHHDQPHFHMVVDGGGYYLLAKQVSNSRFHITAFELTNGQAVYTKKGAIHCDAALKGHIICGYSFAKECETVLLRTKQENKMVEIDFMKH